MQAASQHPDAAAWRIQDDLDLLDAMLADAAEQPALYQPGRFWIKQSRSAVNEIRRHGLTDFRGRSNGIGLSYADKQDVDVRQSMHFGARRALRWLCNNVYPFNRALQAQVNLTLRIADEAIRDKGVWIQQSPRIRELVDRYALPYSLGGGSILNATIDGTEVANHYLALLDTIDRIQAGIDMRQVRSYFEIGGGFGTNVHLLTRNFPGIRKYVYLDIPPNLYVGTQYLRSHLGGAVKDYRSLRTESEIRFADDDSLEVLCIAPWQIERLRSPVDMFHNAHSFVEMPEAVVANYAKHADRLLGPRGAVALVSYDNFDTRTTIHPDRLPGFFSGDFTRTELPMATSPGTTYYYYLRK